MNKSPFKFLDSYSKEDREIFFGRDKEIEELHSRVFESKILIVYGTSGTGKSSLINCGLANKFNDSDWLPVGIRRGSDINRSLYESLARNAISEIPSVSSTGQEVTLPDLPRTIRSIYLDHFKPVFLIFDQFEELFIFGHAKEKDDLARNIKKVIDSDLQCRFIFSIREEYLAGITEFERVIPTFLANRIRIEKMTRQNALQVIEGPCRVNGIELEPGFPEALIEILNPENPEVELTYLQVYLDRIFRLASNNDTEPVLITTDLLEKAGDVKDLLGSFLEEQISQLDDPDLGLIVLKSFVSVKGTKHQISEEEVVDYSKTLGKDVDKENVKSLIQRFVKLRILRDKDENNRYELRHDSLAAKIYEKITLVEKELLEVRQFIDNAYGNYEKRELYLTDDDLNYIAPYEEMLFLNDKVTRFIASSKKEIHRARRRKQNIMAVTAIILITILSFFSIWAFRERSNAVSQRMIADEQRNAAIREKEIADSARQEALVSKNLAIEKEAIAIKAQMQSEAARKEALLQREYALLQRNRAEQLSETANEQAQIATEEKQKAEAEREKAVIAEEKTMKLKMLSVAQNLALRSLTMEDNPQLAGLLAVQAYNFNKSYEGQSEDPVIYEALNRASAILDNWQLSILKGSPNEIRALSENQGSLISADLDGVIRSWTNTGANSILFKLPSDSPINIIGCDRAGKHIMTGHDNNIMQLFTAQLTGSAGDPSVQVLNGHSGAVNAIAFSRDGKAAVTAGRDSLVILWDLENEKAVKSGTLSTDYPVTSVEFWSNDTLFVSLGNGNILIWDVPGSSVTKIYESVSDRPLCLAWNRNRKVLLAGCSNGILLAFDMNRRVPSDPVRNVVHTAGIDILAFNYDYSLFASSSWDKTIKLYDYYEYFEMTNSVGGTKHLKGIDARIRSLIFTSDNELVAGISDRSIRVWETSSARLTNMICSHVGRDMTVEEWDTMVGNEVPYGKTCSEKY